MHRRDLLVACGAGLASAAGCAGLGGDGEPSVDTERLAGMVQGAALPASPLPYAVPARLGERHAERAAALLADVPTDPAIPNAAVRRELARERERAGEREVQAHDWPLAALTARRERRVDAAGVRGAYRAAVGEGARDRLVERRSAVRSSLGTFAADWTYRADGPVAAVLAHAPVDDLYRESREAVRPTPPYPADPVADPFRAGRVVGSVERAAATAADAAGLQAAAVGAADDPSGQWGALTTASDRLRGALDATGENLRAHLTDGADALDRDVGDGLAGWLFERAREQARGAREGARRARRSGRYASAVVESGRALVALEALEAVVERIEAGELGGPTTVESASGACGWARTALADAREARPRGLAAQLCRPALFAQREIVAYLEAGHAAATRVEAACTWAALAAEAVPAATAFLADRLRAAERA